MSKQQGPCGECRSGRDDDQNLGNHRFRIRGAYRMNQRQIREVAVVVAHPDDETLWVGGTLLRLELSDFGTLPGW